MAFARAGTAVIYAVGFQVAKTHTLRGLGFFLSSQFAIEPPVNGSVFLVGPHGSCYILKLLYHLLFLAFRVTDIRTNLPGCLMVWEKPPGVKAVLALDLSCETLLSDLGRLEFFSSIAVTRSIEV